jgi:hypothetical protein
VIESGDVILPPESQALVAGELRTTYTFRCEAQKKPAVRVQARQPEKSGLRALGNFDMLSVNLQTGAKTSSGVISLFAISFAIRCRTTSSSASAPPTASVSTRRNGSLMSSTSAKARRTR